MPTTAKPTSVKPTSTSAKPTAIPTTSKPSSKPTSTKPTTGMPSTRIPTISPTLRPASARPTTTSALSTPACDASGSVGSTTSRACVMRNGVTFDVLARGTATISITSIAIGVHNGSSAQIWTKNGTSVGFEAKMSNWTKIRGEIFRTIPYNGCINVHGERTRMPVILSVVLFLIQIL